MQSPTSGRANFFTTIRVGARGMFALGTRRRKAVNKGFGQIGHVCRLSAQIHYNFFYKLTRDAAQSAQFWHLGE